MLQSLITLYKNPEMVLSETWIQAKLYKQSTFKLYMCILKTIQEALLENAFDSHASTYLLLRNNIDFTIATDIALQECHPTALLELDDNGSDNVKAQTL